MPICCSSGSSACCACTSVSFAASALSASGQRLERVGIIRLADLLYSTRSRACCLRLGQLRRQRLEPPAPAPGARRDRSSCRSAVRQRSERLLRLRLGQLCGQRLERPGQRLERVGISRLVELPQQRFDRLLRLCLGQLRRERPEPPGQRLQLVGIGRLVELPQQRFTACCACASVSFTGSASERLG